MPITNTHYVTGHQITYELQISNSIAFNDDDIVIRMLDIDDATEQVVVRVDANGLRTGAHYARVIARVELDPERFWQVSKNTLEQDGITWYGVTRF